MQHICSQTDNNNKNSNLQQPLQPELKLQQTIHVIVVCSSRDHYAGPYRSTKLSRKFRQTNQILNPIGQKHNIGNNVEKSL